MAQLTQEQFEFLFGPEVKQPTGPTPKKDGFISPAQRIMQEPGSFVDTVFAALDAVNGIIPSIGTDKAPAQAAAESAMEAPISRPAKNVGAGVIALPGVVPGAIDLIGKGVPAIVEGVMDDGDQKVTSRIADAFMDRVLPKESQDKLADIQADALNNFVQSNPGASQKDIEAFHKQYLDSDEFYNSVMDNMSLGLSLAQKNQSFANEVMGLQRPDKMTAGDDAFQIIGQSVLGLPASTVSKMAKPVVKVIGERAAKSIPARVAARAVEAMTPLTLPLTATNVGINAGVGIGINEAIRGLTGQETLIDYNKVYNPSEGPSPEEIGGALGVSAGILFGLPSVSKQIGKHAADATEKAVKYEAPSAGPILKEQSERFMEPQISGVRGLVDQNAPVKAGAQKFGADQDTVQDLDAIMSGASTANRVENVNNTLNYGILDGMDNTVPFVEIEKAFMQLDDSSKMMLDNYVYALQRKSAEFIEEKSLMEQVTKAQNEIFIAQRSSDKRALNEATERFVKAQQKYQELQQDAPNTRSLMRDWSRDDVNNFITQAEANPQIKAVGDAMRKVSGDLLNYMNKNGLIDQATATKWRANRDLHVKVQERPYPDKGPLARRALLFKDKFKNVDQETDRPFFINTASRNVSGEGAVVNNPLPAVAALKESIIDTVRNVAANNARREVIDRLSSLPNATDRLLRPVEFNLGGRKTTSISQEQFNLLYPKGYPNEDDFIKIFRNGKLEMYQFADPMLTKSLQFAPIATVPIFNATRKIFQQLTTGVGAPWFAARAFLWDVPVAQTTKNAGRSLGLIDTFARKLFMGTSLEQPVNMALNNVFDPTAFLAAGVAIPQQLGLRAAKALGDKIASDLAQHSGVFNAIAKSGVAGQRYLEMIGFTMAKSFDEVVASVGFGLNRKFEDSPLAEMSRNMSTSMSHLNDVSNVRNDYASAASGASGYAKALFNGYKAMLDSVHMSTRYAFFANNYALLKQKHKGKVPPKELRKLVQETRNLTGDMSRQSLNKTVQKATSVIPYSNAMIQGTRHILSSAIPHSLREGINVAGGNIIRDKDTRFWTQFLSGVGIPTLGSLAFLSNWEGAEDYWYNQTPKWKQMSGIPIPSVDTITEMVETGKLPEFTPERLNVVPIAPELSMLLWPVTQAARAMGILGKVPTTTPQPASQQIKDVLDQITSFSTPPILSAALATGGNRLDLHALVTGQGGMTPINNPGSGANADMMTTDSNIPHAVYDTLGALFGSAAQVAMQTLNVFDMALEDGAEFTDAAASAFDTASFEVKRRLPEISNPLWDARQRAYAFTPESEYVYKTERSLEPIIGPDRQLSIERDTKNRVGLSEELGLAAPQKLRDPNLRAVSTVIWDNMKKKGPYKEASDEYSRIRKLLIDLENSRVRMPDDRYNKMRNELVQKQQEYTRTKSRVLQSLERQLAKQVGRQFQENYGVEFSYENLSKLVRKDVRGNE